MPYDGYGNYVPYENTQTFSEEDAELGSFLEQTVPSYVADMIYASNGVALSQEQAYALGEEMVSRLDAYGVNELVEDINAAYFSEGEEADEVSLSEFAGQLAAVYQDIYANNGYMLSDADAWAFAVDTVQTSDEDELYALAEEVGSYGFVAPAAAEGTLKKIGGWMRTEGKTGAEGLAHAKDPAKIQGQGLISRSLQKHGAGGDAWHNKASKWASGQLEGAKRIAHEHGPRTRGGKIAAGVGALGIGGAAYGAGRNKDKRKLSEDFSDSPAHRRAAVARRLQQMGYGTKDGLFF